MEPRPSGSDIEPVMSTSPVAVTGPTIDDCDGAWERISAFDVDCEPVEVALRAIS